MNKKTRRIFSVLEDVAAGIERVANARISSCIVYKNDIVSIGTNQFKTHPFQALHSRNDESIYWHAENQSIYNARKILSNDELQRCSLYVCRLDQSHNQCLSKPCSGCMKAIRKYKLKRVFYTDSVSIKMLNLGIDTVSEAANQ